SNLPDARRGADRDRRRQGRLGELKVLMLSQSHAEAGRAPFAAGAPGWASSNRSASATSQVGVTEAGKYYRLVGEMRFFLGKTCRFTRLLLDRPFWSDISSQPTNLVGYELRSKAPAGCSHTRRDAERSGPERTEARAERMTRSAATF